MNKYLKRMDCVGCDVFVPKSILPFDNSRKITRTLLGIGLPQAFCYICGHYWMRAPTDTPTFGFACRGPLLM